MFLADGTPGGIRTAEITNWTGHVVTGARSGLGELLKRDELSRTGVYILLGDEETAPGGISCYIGEADVVSTRLQHHHRDKDYWDRVVVITSKDANLTKAHGRYLESALIRLAAAADRSEVKNSTAPAAPPLPEADRSDMDYFVGQLQIILPVLGVNILRGRAAAKSPMANDLLLMPESPVFRLQVARRGVDASAQQIDGEFTLLAGSIVAATVRQSDSFSSTTAAAYRGYNAIHDKLVADGSVVIEGALARATRDIPFTSPSTAGAIATGRSCNGRKQWVTDEGVMFGTWESRGVSDLAQVEVRETS